MSSELDSHIPVYQKQKHLEAETIVECALWIERYDLVLKNH